MVNFQFNLASVAGIVLMVGGAALYAVRSWRPELSRDHDIFFSAVGLLCGLILIFYGWRFDPIMQFGQVMLTGSSFFFVFENLRLRRVATEQAKRTTPIVDEDRPTSRVYRAELDELGPIEERPVTRRIRGTRDARPGRDDYEEGSRRRPSSRSSSDDRMGPSARSGKRRPRPAQDLGETDTWGDSSELDDRPSRSRGPVSTSGNQPPSSSSRPRRPRPSEDGPRRPREEDTQPSDYVDYRPVDPPGDEETDNWGEY